MSTTTADLMNTASCRGGDAPFTAEFFRDMPLWMEAVFILDCILFGTNLLLSARFLLTIARTVKDDSFRCDLYVLMLCPLVVGSVAFLSIIFPRSANTLYVIGIFDGIFALYTVNVSVMRIFGGAERCAEWMIANGKTLQMRFCGLTTAKCPPTVANLRLLGLPIFLLPPFHLCVEIIELLLTNEGVPRNWIFTVIGFVRTISMIIAILCVIILCRAVTEVIRPYSVWSLLIGVKTCDGVLTIFRQVFDGFINHGVFRTERLSAEVAGHFWFNSLVTVIVTVIAVLFTIRVRPGKSVYFDLAAAPQLESIQGDTVDK